MPGGYWVAILALGLAASVAWAQDQEPSGTFIEGQPIPAARQGDGPPDDEGAGGDAAPVAGPVADPPPLARHADALMSVLDRIEAAIRDLPTPAGDEERQRQARDLRAREDVAFWAMAIFWAILGAVVMAAIALAGVLRALRRTRLAAGEIIGEARETTRAATAAAERAGRASDIAGRALGALNRPYIIPIVVAHNLPRYVTAKSSADQELTASVIYRNSGSSPAVLKKISPIASTVPATAEPEPLNPYYSNRDLFLELGASYLEPGQATRDIAVSCSLPKRVRELAAARGIGFSFLTEDAAKVILQDRITYTDLLGNETVVYVRYDYVLGFFELMEIREERASFRENVERMEQGGTGAAPA